MSYTNKKALARLVVFCLGTSALTLPVLAATYNVGGGTITTSQADATSDSTGTGGPFALQANTVSAGDAITITGVSITNTSQTPNGRALDVGGLLASSGSYSVVMHGSTLTGDSGFSTGGAGAWFQSVGGTVSFDSTGGPANTISGKQGLAVINNTSNGGVSIKTGADRITSSDGEAVYGVAQGTGTISIDSAGATITAGGLYGISAVGGNGAITIGGLNGGIASTINAANGAGIYTISSSAQSITLAASGVINAQTGISVLATSATIDSFGVINASNTAIVSLNGTNTPLTVTLESGSVTKGQVIGGGAADTFNIVAGADISNASFAGGGGADVLSLQGSSSGTFSLSSASAISVLQMNGSGTWGLTGSGGGFGSVTVNSGTLRMAAGASLSAMPSLIVNGGTFDLNGQNQAVGALSGTGGAITLGNGTLTTNSNANTSLASIISGSGSLIKAGTGTLALAGAQTYSGGTTVNGGVLQVTSGASLATGPLTINSGAVAEFDGSFTNTNATITVNSGGTLLLRTAGTTPLAGSKVIMAGGLLDTDTSVSLGSVEGTGALTLHNNAFTVGALNSNTTLAATVTAAQLNKIGTGTLTLTGANTYTQGGVSINAGAVILGTTGSLTTDSLNIRGGGSFVAATSTTISALSFDSGTLAAASGATLNFTNNITFAGNGPLVFGSSTLTGTITLAGTGCCIPFNSTVEIAGGTLRDLTSPPSPLDNNGGLSFAAYMAPLFTVDAGATVDFNDHSVRYSAQPSRGLNLRGAGQVLLGSSASTEMQVRSTNFSGVISGAGTVTFLSNANTHILSGANAYTGGTTINSGASLQLGNGGTSGSIVGSVTDNGALIFNRSDVLTFAGTISGSGTVTQAGRGTLTLTSADTYSGGTTISAGILQIGAGASTGSVAGNVVDNASLVFNRSDALIFAGVISGTGTVAQSGSGTLTLSGTGTYTGATSVNAGTLNVTGKIAGSSVNVASGATLTGTGTVGATTVASGGTVTPGVGGVPGTLAVSGNLTLASGSNFVDFATPASAGLVTASGAASINGNALVNFASGTYAPGQRYTLITATGGLSGSFASLSVSGLPTSVKGRLSYDASGAYLNLDPNTLAPSLSDATTNQSSGVGAIDAAVAAGGTPSGGFTALYNLSGSTLSNAVNQISAQIGPSVTTAVGQGFQSFLSLAGEGGAGGGNFAPGSAYGATGAPHRAQLGAGETRVWGAVYGGHVGLSADAASGAASLSASNVGFVSGVDMQVADDLMAGATVGFGRQDFSSGNGTGDSHDVMIGVHARKEAGPVYVSAAFGYGWHQITTQRVVTISGTDVLQGKEDADDFGGRLEAGWRTMLDNQYRLSPYAAVSAESFETPAYAETAISGASTFALSFAAHSSTLGRSELGTDVGRNYETDDGVLAADLRIAWAHQLDDAPFTLASFQSLPGSSFLVAGVRPARDDALLGASLEMRERSGFFLGVRGESLLGSGTTTVEGMGELGWRW